jgi:hypothetical protein
VNNRKHPRFGDRVTNTSAGDGNPQKHGIFVRVVRDSYRNRYGVTHSTTWYEITDGSGKFWKIDPRSIQVVAANQRGGD